MTTKRYLHSIIKKIIYKKYCIVAVSEGEFYIGGFVFLKFLETVMTGSMNFSNTKPPK